jgi:tetratricopeptide (TPR) repeat protein
MRRLLSCGAVLAFILLVAGTASAQLGQVKGQVLDLQGKPYANLNVTIKNNGTGQTLSTKTDKNGNYQMIGLPGGAYTITLNDPKTGLNFVEQFQVSAGEETDHSINLQQIQAQQQGAHPEEQKKNEAAANQFKEMKGHVDAGVAALNDADTLRKQLATTPADQKSSIQDKLNTDYQTAITELTAAEKVVGEKDAKNHAVVLANLAQAQSYAGKYDDAAANFQKAADLNPQAGIYLNLSLAQAHQATELTDPAAVSAKIADAGASCDKAGTLDPTTTAKCWKNVGILLSNKGDLKEAIAPLQKATNADAKDAQAWYLLGGAYMGTIEAKQVGDKMTYDIPPGAGDAYQKCIDADPNGPYAPQCKMMLDSITAMGGGQATTVGEVPKKKKK